MNDTIIDLRLLDDHPEALAKITEALAKVCYDTILKKGFDTRIEEAYEKAFRLCPNYRLILLDSPPNFGKYRHLEKVKEFAEITSLPLTYP